MTFLAQAAEWQAALVGIVALVLGGGIGYAVAYFLAVRKARQTESEGERTVSKARADADAILKEARVTAKEEAIRAREAFEKETARTREELRERERVVTKHEDGIDAKMETLTRKEKAVEAGYTQVADMEKSLKAKHADLDQKIADEKRVLIKVAGLDQNQARQMLLERMEGEVQHEAAALIQRATEHAQEESEQKARQILAGAIQRLASDYTAEVTVATVDIPSDEMKGRIIGREGRNIRAFERVTGVDVIVDDTPGVVVLSSFDSVRREIARRSLAKLISDGRIQPPRIEQVVSECKKEVEADINETGKQVALDTGVRGLHPKEVQLLGRLKYRTSYGQSVLQHSIEVAHLSGMLAEELGLDGQLARRYNECEEVIHAIGGHHEPNVQDALYTIVVSAADAVSASRPGARRETLEKYVQRLEKLEEIARRFEGVEMAYAIQAGREVRVVVNADKVDDDLAIKVCRDIAKAVEAELTYPGEVKVTLIRERRVVEYAR
ncbi:MAG: ribonuclease Y [Planctomycetota bacterium]|nr:ribonuclease Y [Planctomycetota bacterium]